MDFCLSSSWRPNQYIVFKTSLNFKEIKEKFPKNNIRKRPHAFGIDSNVSTSLWKERFVSCVSTLLVTRKIDIIFNWVWDIWIKDESLRMKVMFKIINLKAPLEKRKQVFCAHKMEEKINEGKESDATTSNVFCKYVKFKIST